MDGYDDAPLEGGAEVGTLALSPPPSDALMGNREAPAVRVESVSLRCDPVYVYPPDVLAAVLARAAPSGHQ